MFLSFSIGFFLSSSLSFLLFLPLHLNISPPEYTHQMCFSPFSLSKFFHIFTFLSYFCIWTRTGMIFSLDFLIWLEIGHILQNNIFLGKRWSVISSVLDGGHKRHSTSDNCISFVGFLHRIHGHVSGRSEGCTCQVNSEDTFLTFSFQIVQKFQNDIIPFYLIITVLKFISIHSFELKAEILNITGILGCVVTWKDVV